MTELLADPYALAPLVSAALKPVLGPAHADLLVVTHDADEAAPAVIKAVHVVNTSLSTRIPLLLPAPEIQAWLTRKRAIELAYDREHCTVPVPDEEALKKDAKAELLRLLGTFGGRFNAKMQASLAECISAEDLGHYDWSGWNQAAVILQAALVANGIESLEP